MSKYRILAFDKSYQKDNFDCGIEDLNIYLKKYASQDIKRKFAQVFIISPSNSEEIIGFYTLSAFTIQTLSLPLEIAKKLPKYPVPVSLLGRLAVDVNYQKKGIGKFLLADAIKRVIKASEIIGIYALVVSAKNEKVKSFYKRYGFIELLDENNHLFIPLKTAIAISNDLLYF